MDPDTPTQAELTGPVHPLRIAEPGPALRITPGTVTVDFGWNQSDLAPEEWGQDFEVTYVHGGEPLEAPAAVFLRANFMMADPSSPADVLTGTGDGNDYGTETSVLQLLATAWKVGGLGFQALNPRNANHVALVASETRARLRMGRPMLVNVQRRVVPVLVVSGTLRAGESFTVRVRGACSAGGRNPTGLVTSANEHAFAAVVGRPEQPGGDPGPLRYELVTDVSGGWLLPLAPCGVHVVAPSRVRAGREVELRLAVLDEMDNLTPGYRGTVQLSCSDPDAQFPAAVTLHPDAAGRARVSVTLRTPGVHRFTAHAFGREFATGPVEVLEHDAEHQLLWGDYHLHSWRCDGSGDPTLILRYARDAAFLDWCALTSHDAPAWPLAGAMRWDDIAATVDGCDEPGRLVTLPAFEWTSGATGDEVEGDETAYATNADGHHIVLARDWRLLLEPFLPTFQDRRSDTAWKLHRELIRRSAGRPGERTEVLVVPHDLMCNNWWAINVQCPPGGRPVAAREQERYAPLAQIYSTLHGNHESPQEDGTSGEPDGWRPHSKYYGQPAELAGFVNGLKYGGIYGVTAGADSHAGRPGSFLFGALTAVLARDHTREAVFDALAARHTYATSGHRLLMEFSYRRADGSTAIMGDRVEYAAADRLAPELAYRVVSPLPIRRVRIVRVRAPLPGEEPFQSVESPTLREDAWKFVEYVLDRRFGAGERPLEGEGVLRDDGFRAAEWRYASYFLVVEHENERRHARDVTYPDPADDPGYHLQDRGWTSPIFFRRRGAADAGQP